VELRAALAARRMARAFEPTPLAAGLLDDLLDQARRAPSAGNTNAVSFVVLEGEATTRYWDITLPEPRRSTFAWPGLLRAPALVLVVTDPSAYVRRYAEADKASRGLGVHADAWPVPYWFVDAGCVVENLLLLAAEAELGALLFGPFEHESPLCAAFGIVDGRRIVGVVALGHAADEQRPSRSAARGRPALSDIVRRAT
jgi:nitroreductase